MPELSFDDLESLNEELNDSTRLVEYAQPYDHYKPSLVPRILGTILVYSGNILYGRTPSYLKFRAVEVIARVPYQSWSSAIYTLLTFAYTDEQRALRLVQDTRYARLAHDNETMHVVVISQLAKLHCRAGFIRHTLIPLLFSFGYFWASYVLYLVNEKYSYELNYLFESHAFAQYREFLETNEDLLKSRPIASDFLSWYGRSPRSEFEFFRSVRNDELIHRNTTVRRIGSV
ncbi:hypothetical protein BH11PAT2_BH11PAT2_07220 [soil metagenome]